MALQPKRMSEVLVNVVKKQYGITPKYMVADDRSGIAFDDVKRKAIKDWAYLHCRGKVAVGSVAAYFTRKDDAVEFLLTWGE